MSAAVSADYLGLVAGLSRFCPVIVQQPMVVGPFVVLSDKRWNARQPSMSFSPGDTGGRMVALGIL